MAVDGDAKTRYLDSLSRRAQGGTAAVVKTACRERAGSSASSSGESDYPRICPDLRSEEIRPAFPSRHWRP